MINSCPRLFLVTLTLLCGAMTSAAPQDDKKPSRPQPKLPRGQAIKPFKTNYYDGIKLVMTLTSEEMTPLDDQNDNLQLIRPTAIFYLEPRDKTQKVTRVQLVSQKGHVHVPTRVVTLRDSVRMETSTDAHLETTELAVDTVKKRATTDQAFRMLEPGLEVTGTGLDLDYESKTLWIKKDLWGKLTGDPKKVVPGTPATQKPSKDPPEEEVTEFWAQEGLRRAPLDPQTAKEKNATEWYEFNKNVKVLRTVANPQGTFHETLSCDVLKLLARREKPPADQSAPNHNTPEVVELHARNHVTVHSTQGGDLKGDHLTWDQRQDIMVLTSQTVSSGTWKQNAFSGKRIEFHRPNPALKRTEGLLRCLQQASARMQPEKEDQSPMTIEADRIEAQIVETGREQELKKFRAEQNVTLTWSDQKNSTGQSGEKTEASRAMGRRFDWEQGQGMGILTDTPVARVIQGASLIEAPSIMIYNNPQRVILKGPKCLTLKQETPQGILERRITSEGDMIMDPTRGRIQILRRVTITGPDMTMVADSMEILLAKDNKNIEKMIGTGHIRVDYRARKVTLIGDRLTWEPSSSITEVSGTPYAYADTPEFEMLIGTLRYNERTGELGQLEGYRGSMRSILNFKNVPDKEKKQK